MAFEYLQLLSFRYEPQKHIVLCFREFADNIVSSGWRRYDYISTSSEVATDNLQILLLAGTIENNYLWVYLLSEGLIAEIVDVSDTGDSLVVFFDG